MANKKNGSRKKGSTNQTPASSIGPKDRTVSFAKGSEITTNNEKQSDDHIADAAIVNLTRALVRWTAGLTIATILLGIAAAFQWSELHKTDKTLRDTLSASERAWIAAGEIDTYKEPKLGEPFSLSILYYNVGRSPAIGMISQHLPKVVKAVNVTKDTTMGGKNLSCDGLSPNDQGVVVSPRNIATGYLFYIPGDFITADVISGASTLIVQGCFAYETLGETHFTRYCAPAVFGGRGTKKENFSLCGDGQWAD